MENVTLTSYSKQDILDFFKEALTEFFKDHPLLNSSLPPLQDEKINGLQGLADYLGVKKNAIQTYKRNGAIPFYQVGNTIYFKRSEVDASIASGAIRKKKNVEYKYCISNH